MRIFELKRVKVIWVWCVYFLSAKAAWLVFINNLFFSLSGYIRFMTNSYLDSIVDSFSLWMVLLNKSEEQYTVGICSKISQETLNLEFVAFGPFLSVPSL